MAPAGASFRPQGPWLPFVRCRPYSSVFGGRPPPIDGRLRQRQRRCDVAPCCRRCGSARKNPGSCCPDSAAVTARRIVSRDCRSGARHCVATALGRRARRSQQSSAADLGVEAGGPGGRWPSSPSTTISPAFSALSMSLRIDTPMAVGLLVSTRRRSLGRRRGSAIRIVQVLGCLSMSSVSVSVTDGPPATTIRRVVGRRPSRRRVGVDVSDEAGCRRQLHRSSAVWRVQSRRGPAPANSVMSR